jgi:hypothetical protein
MNPLSTYGVNLGTVLSEIAAGNFRFGFEVQFNQIQNTAIKRTNSEIERLIKNDTTPTLLAAQERDVNKLQKNKALIDSFNFDMNANQLQLAKMQTDVTDAIAAFSAVDDTTNLTTEEVATLTAKRDALLASTSALLLSIHPDIATPFVVRDVKNMYDTLKAMNPVAGVVDAAGTTPATNDNRQILDDLNKLSGLVNTAYDVTTTTAENSSSISFDLSARLAEKLADITQLSDVELKKRQQEIEDIKSRYGNMLRVISLSFEARRASMEQLGKSLQTPQIEPGSVMNLFS